MIRIESKTKEEAAELCYAILEMGFGEDMEFNIFMDKKMKNPTEKAVFAEVPEMVTFDEDVEFEEFYNSFMKGVAATGVADYKGGRYSFGWAPELNGILVNFVDNPIHEQEFLDEFNEIFD